MGDDYEGEGEAAEAEVEQFHQLMLEVKGYLEDTATTPKGQKLLGKVEFALDNWDDDALFGSEEDEGDEGDGEEGDGEEGDDEEGDDDEGDVEEFVFDGSILDALEDEDDDDD